MSRHRLFAFLIPLLVVLPGASVGFQFMLPPPPPPGVYICGQGIIPAMLIGMPIGAAVSMIAGWLFGEIIDRRLASIQRAH